jgi:molybdopterin synthase sulfur carrier subunit
VKITYQSWLGKELGCGEEEIALPPGVNNVGMLLAWLATRGPRYEDAFQFVEVVKVVVNRAYATEDQPVGNDDDVILIPPIAGG